MFHHLRLSSYIPALLTILLVVSCDVLSFSLTYSEVMSKGFLIFPLKADYEMRTIFLKKTV